MFRRVAMRYCERPAASTFAKSITVTDKCYARIAARNAAAAQPSLLRLSVVTGGCHGFSYKFEYDAEQPDAEDDVLFTQSTPAVDASAEAAKAGAVLVSDRESLSKLQGATIDYHAELKGEAFVCIGNELVDEACSCGASFSMRGAKKPFDE